MQAVSRMRVGMIVVQPICFSDTPRADLVSSQSQLFERHNVAVRSYSSREVNILLSKEQTRAETNTRTDNTVGRTWRPIAIWAIYCKVLSIHKQLGTLLFGIFGRCDRMSLGTLVGENFVVVAA